MALIEINRRCDECEKTREAIHALQSRVDRFELDYQNLYEKVRTNLAKLAKRAKVAEDGPEDNGQGDPLAKYRSALVQRKLSKLGG